MERLEKLTELQKLQLIDFQQECLDIGLSTARIDRTKNQESVNYIYKNYFNIDKAPYIWYVDSPLTYNIIINMLYNLTDNKSFKFSFEKHLEENFKNRLSFNLWSSFCNKITEILANVLRNKLKENLGSNFLVNLRRNLKNDFSAELQKNIKAKTNFNRDGRDGLWLKASKNLKNILDFQNTFLESIDDLDTYWNIVMDNKKVSNKIFNNIIWSNLDTYWISLYMFPLKYLGADYGRKLNYDLNLFFELYKNAGCIFCHSDVCFISEKPIEINRKGSQLHADKKPAVLFADGYSLWYLNGVCVPKDVVLLNAEDIDVDLVFKEKNIEVRREIIKKIRIENVIKKIKYTIIDKSSDNGYELLKIDLQLRQPSHYLKMRNPSIDTYHLEGVPFQCDTVEKALAWRDSEWEINASASFPNYVVPQQLT